MFIYSAQKGLVMKRDNTMVKNNYRLKPMSKSEHDILLVKEKKAEVEFQKEVDDKFNEKGFSGVKKTKKQLEALMRKQKGMRKTWDDKPLIDKVEHITAETLFAFVPEMSIFKKTKNIGKPIISNTMKSFKDAKSINKVADIEKTIAEGTRKLIDDNKSLYKLKATDPRNIEKVRTLDKEEGLRGYYEGALKDWVDNKYDDAIEFVRFKDSKIAGEDTYDIDRDEMYSLIGEYVFKKEAYNTSRQNALYVKISNGDKGFNDYIHEVQRNRFGRGQGVFKRVTRLNDNLKNNPSDIGRVVSHELKHNINSGGAYIGPKYQQKVKDVFKSRDDVANLDMGNFDYYTSPTEVMSYLGTNLKDRLVSEGILKSVHDNVTYDMVNKLYKGNYGILNKYRPFIKDKKKFIDLINITPYSIGIIGVYKDKE